jgi:hypothetical protein
MLHATMPIKLHGAVILGPRFFLWIKSIEPFELACDQVLSAPSKKFLPLHYFIENQWHVFFFSMGECFPFQEFTANHKSSGKQTTEIPRAQYAVGQPQAWGCGVFGVCWRPFSWL